MPAPPRPWAFPGASVTSFEHREVQANGISLHVVTAGDPKKPAVMFLHGFPEGWFSWRSIMEALADDYFVLAPDLRGYGQSDKPADGYGLMALTDDVHDIVKQLTNKPIGPRCRRTAAALAGYPRVKPLVETSRQVGHSLILCPGVESPTWVGKSESP